MDLVEQVNWGGAPNSALRWVLAERDGRAVGALYGFWWREVFAYYQMGWEPELADTHLGIMLVSEAIRLAGLAGLATALDRETGDRVWQSRPPRPSPTCSPRRRGRSSSTAWRRSSRRPRPRGCRSGSTRPTRRRVAAWRSIGWPRVLSRIGPLARPSMARGMWNRFWRWYERHYLLNVAIASVSRMPRVL